MPNTNLANLILVNNSYPNYCFTDVQTSTAGIWTDVWFKGSLVDLTHIIVKFPHF